MIVTDYGKGCKQTILSNLYEKYGGIIFKARKGNYCDPIVTITSSREYEFISAIDYVNLISERKANSLYVAAHVIENIALSDLFTNYPEAYTKEEFEKPSLWMGQKVQLLLCTRILETILFIKLLEQRDGGFIQFGIFLGFICQFFHLDLI